jgi:glucosamine-6-phosphate deaminase
MRDARIEVLPSADAAACRAADYIVAMAARPYVNLGLPTGKTPIAMYAELRRRVAAGRADLRHEIVWAIDEFVGPGTDAQGTNRAFYQEHVGLGQRQLLCPDAAAGDPEAHIAGYAKAIRKAHGLDLCLLGIGMNGHIAFNEPGSGRDSRARVVDLTEESRGAHAEDFGSLEAVPKRGMTLGIADLLESRLVVVMATGESKAAIVARAIEGPQTAKVPASWVQSVEALWLLVEAAASGLRRRR